jgi:hypothetical protein
MSGKLLRKLHRKVEIMISSNMTLRRRGHEEMRERLLRVEKNI